MSWVGSKCHVVETAEPGEINLITGMLQQAAHRSDQLIHERLRAEEERHNLKPEKLYVDGNYLSAEHLRMYSKAGQTLMGYTGKSSSKKAEGFKLQDFQIDMKELRAECPGKQTSSAVSQSSKGLYTMYFSQSTCSRCKHFSECVGPGGEKKRKLTVLPDYEYLQARRREQKTDDFKKEMKVRAQIEGTISELVRFHGLRKIKYIGTKGRTLQFYLSATGLNVKRLLRILKEGKKLKKRAGK